MEIRNSHCEGGGAVAPPEICREFETGEMILSLRTFENKN
jgi:hypothetical protein